MSTETKDSIKLFAIVALSICCYYYFSSLDILSYYLTCQFSDLFIFLSFMFFIGLTLLIFTIIFFRQSFVYIILQASLATLLYMTFIVLY